jgi:two-component system, NarL family, sensor histidine kinase ComP
MLNQLYFKRKRKQGAGGPDMDFQHDFHSDHISPQLRQAAFRIVRESLANACRHSKNQKLFAELTLDGDVLHIRIWDWVVDFNSDNVPPGQFVSNGIHHRVKLLNGTATFGSEPGKGTCVSIELPLGGNLIIDSRCGKGTCVMVEIPLFVAQLTRENVK